MARPKDVVIADIEAKLPTLFDSKRHRFAHYAGEFFSQETVAQITAQATHRLGTFFYDVESIRSINSRRASDVKSSAADEYIIIVYCCAPNKFRPDVAWQNSYELAYELRQGIEGTAISELAGEYGRGVWFFEDIVQEFHTKDLSCHSIRLRIILPSKVEA